MATTKPLRKKPLVRARVSTRVLNSFEVDDIHLLRNDNYDFRFSKVVSKPDKYDFIKQVCISIELKFTSGKAITDLNVAEVDSMEIEYANALFFIDGGYEDGTTLVSTILKKKDNTDLFNNILADLMNIKNIVKPSYSTKTINRLITSEATKRVRIDFTMHSEKIEKGDIVTALTLNTFVEDI
jgi:hypothetical protein